MHPTPEEQLQAVRRLIEQVAADPDLAPQARDLLDDAGRLVRRLERTLALRLPFLAADNALAIELLDSLAPHLPRLAAEIAATATRPKADDEPSAHALNKDLRRLLARAVDLLPDGPVGDAGRARIAAHLRARLAADPTLNRTPTDRRHPPEHPEP